MTYLCQRIKDPIPTLIPWLTLITCLDYLLLKNYGPGEKAKDFGYTVISGQNFHDLKGFRWVKSFIRKICIHLANQISMHFHIKTDYIPIHFSTLFQSMTLVDLTSFIEFIVGRIMEDFTRIHQIRVAGWILGRDVHYTMIQRYLSGAQKIRTLW